MADSVVIQTVAVTIEDVTRAVLLGYNTTPPKALVLYSYARQSGASAVYIALNGRRLPYIIWLYGVGYLALSPRRVYGRLCYAQTGDSGSIAA